MKNDTDKHPVGRTSGRGYMLKLLMNIGISTVITVILEILLVTNVTAFSGYLYQTGNDSQTVERFAFGSLVSVLLFVLFGILIFAITLFLMERKTARDIEKIAGAVEQISAGDLSTRLDIAGDGELADIADSITRMERDIRDLIERERSSEQSKTDLITNVAHDLRTPLTSILGYLELLKTRENLTPETRQKYVEIAYSKSKRLQKLIEELFGFTKLSYGKLNMTITDVDIVRLLAQLLEESYPNFEKNHMSYDFTANVDSQVIRADGDLLARLFDNLINNAIKYGKEGKRVTVRLRADTQWVLVRVINYGYVIPENELPLIFDKFYRVEHSRSSSTGGTGLGLAIVKNIAEMHHGTVSVSSSLAGTVFTVKLPVEYHETPAGKSAEHKESKG